MNKLLADVKELKFFRLAINNYRYELAFNYMKETYANFGINDKYVVTTVQSMLHLSPSTQDEWDMLIQTIYSLVDDAFSEYMDRLAGIPAYEEIL